MFSEELEELARLELDRSMKEEQELAFSLAEQQDREKEQEVLRQLEHRRVQQLKEEERQRLEEDRVASVEEKRRSAEARLPAEPLEGEVSYEVKIRTPTSVLQRSFKAAASVANIQDFVVSQGFQANRC